MQYKYFAFDMDAGEMEFFITPEQALNWVNLAIDEHHEEGIGPESMDGGIGWGEIKQVSRWTVQERRSDYDARGEDWPFGEDWDVAGPLLLVDVGNES